MLRDPDTRNRILLLVLALLLWAPRLQGPIDLRYDAGVYYITGTALAEGKGYRLLNEPGEILAVQYPPLLPAFVALHQWALGTSDPGVVGWWLRLSFFLIFLGYALAVYALARRYLAPLPALLVGGITLLYHHSYFLSDLLFAEIPFALVTVLFALANRKSDRAPYFAVTALLAVAAYLLRTAGVALLAAWIAESILRARPPGGRARRWKQAALRAAVCLVPVVVWQAYINRVTSGEEYQHPAYTYQRAPYQYYNVSYGENIVLVDPFIPELGRVTPAGMAERFFDNLAAMPAGLGVGVTYGEAPWRVLLHGVQRRLGVDVLPDWAARVPMIALGCLIMAGAIVFLMRGEWLIPLYLGASVALICLTPWPGQFARYLTPLTPFLALCLLRLLTAVREYSLRHWAGRWRRAGTYFLALVVIGVLGTEVTVAVYACKAHHESGPTFEGRLFYYDPFWGDYDAALAWLAERAEPGEVLATSAPHWAYLNTGRRAVMPPMEADPAEAQRLLDSVPVRYVVVDALHFVDMTRRYAAPAVLAHPQAWERVYASPDGKTCVYRRVG